MTKASEGEIEPSQDSGPPGFVVYFAYGSNMATDRLRTRTPSCERLGLATLPGHELRFHKRSTDNSAKCNAFVAGDDSSVIGVLFRFDHAERRDLDTAEGVGKGYKPATVTVIDEKGRKLEALTYLATSDAIDESLKPYSWYKNHVLVGSREHELPPAYVAAHIEKVEAVEDPNRARDERERATVGKPRGSVLFTG